MRKIKWGVALKKMEWGIGENKVIIAEKKITT